MVALGVYVAIAMLNGAIGFCVGVTYSNWTWAKSCEKRETQYGVFPIPSPRHWRSNAYIVLAEMEYVELCVGIIRKKIRQDPFR